MTTDIVQPPRSAAAHWAGLAVFVLVVTAVAVFGALAVSGTSTEYAALERPGWAPPSWLFGPVWTILYGMIAVSGWLVWRQVGVTGWLWPYGVQLLLNAAWTPIFFGAGQYGWALVDIVVLWCAIAVTVLSFWRVFRSAAWLLLPYWLWVSYASALNAAIWWLNR